MKKSFKDVDTTVQEVEETALTATATEVVDPTAISSEVAISNASSAVVPDKFFQNEGVEGEFSASDVKVPRFNLAQAVGPLSTIMIEGTDKAMFPPGTFVYDRQRALGTTGVKITLLRLKKYFAEDLPYDENGPRPRIFVTERDVRQAGGFMVWEKKEQGDDQDYFKPVLDATVLIEGQPDWPEFPLEFEGVPYAKAIWTLQSTAYSRVARQFITAATLNLRTALYGAPWIVSSKREKIGKNWVHVPNVRQAPRHSAEFQAFAKSYV